jgi:hypothetical protein
VLQRERQRVSEGLVQRNRQADIAELETQLSVC